LQFIAFSLFVPEPAQRLLFVHACLLACCGTAASLDHVKHLFNRQLVVIIAAFMNHDAVS
jgi:hypothetical protein